MRPRSRPSLFSRADSSFLAQDVNRRLPRPPLLTGLHSPSLRRQRCALRRRPYGLVEAVVQAAVPEAAVEAKRCVLAVPVARCRRAARILFGILIEEILCAEDERQRVLHGIRDFCIEQVVAPVVGVTVLVVIPTVVLAHASQ